MLLALKILAFCISYFLGIGIGVILHELGHALLALLLTRQKVVLEWGTGPGYGSFHLGRLEIRVSGSGLRYGATRYDRGLESRFTQLWVAAAGPLASLAVVVICVFFAQTFPAGSWGWLGCLSLAVASFRILVVAVWPIEYQADGKGEIWVSDGLDLWRLWRSRK